MKQENKTRTYLLLLYWIVEAVSLLFVGGFGSLPIFMSIIVLILCILRFFLKNHGYRVTFALLLFLYSLIFCFISLPASVFIHDAIMKILIYTISISNLMISILMLRELRKEIK